MVSAIRLDLRNFFDGFDDESYKAIPLTAHAIHDGNAVDFDIAGVYTKLRRLQYRVCSLGSRDKQLAWHAAHTDQVVPISPPSIMTTFLVHALAARNARHTG